MFSDGFRDFELLAESSSQGGRAARLGGDGAGAGSGGWGKSAGAHGVACGPTAMLRGSRDRYRLPQTIRKRFRKVLGNHDFRLKPRFLSKFEIF